MISRHSWKLVWYVAVTFFITTVALAIANAPTEARGGLRQDPLPEVPLMLTSNGFDPAELRPQSGRFLLSIDNRSGDNDLVLRLKRADGSQVRELHVSGAGGDWNETLDLTPGTYTLSEANHSSWLCTIIVH